MGLKLKRSELGVLGSRALVLRVCGLALHCSKLGVWGFGFKVNPKP